MNQSLRRPGRHHSGEPFLHAPNAALLIDFDNVTLGIRSDLTKELKTLLGSDIIKGKVAVQRAYADWRRYPQYIVPLSESSIDLIFAPAFGTNKKNATDIRLAIDAIELVFTRPEIGTFILLSGDSDFSTMVIKLKEYGKYVIGVGIRESASDLLIQNCDEYYSYSDLVGLTREADTPSVQRDPWELVGEAVAMMARNGDVMRSDRLKQVMQQLDPNFDEKNAGYNRFSKFIVEAGHKGLLRVNKMENGQYEVAPVSAATLAPSEPAILGGPSQDGGRDEASRRGRARRGRGRGREHDRERSRERDRAPAGNLTLAQAFSLMRTALSQLPTPVNHEPLRLRMVALHGREDPLLEAGRFLKLLRQANDAEIADVRKVDDDTYEISPHSADLPLLPESPALRPSESSAQTVGAVPSEPPTSFTPPTAPLLGPDNGHRLGLRFRRGSKLPLNRSSVPMVGVVSIEPEAASPGEPSRSPGKPARRRTRAPRKKVPVKNPSAEASAEGNPTGAGPAPAPSDLSPGRKKRPRARARKKVE